METKLPDHVREELRLDSTVGAGNFFHAAYRVNEIREVPILFSDRPIRTPWTGSAESLSLDGLKTVVDRLAGVYLARSVSVFDPVAVYLDEGVEYLIHHIALTSIGAIPVLVNGGLTAEVAAAHLVRTGAVGAYTDDARRAGLRDALGPDAVRFLDTDATASAVRPAPLPQWYPFQHDDDDPVMITHTSGTTGVPKAVPLLHGRFFHGVRQLLGLPGVAGSDRLLSCLPPSHNATMAYAMHAMINGSRMLVASERDAAHVLGLIERFRPGSVVSFPNIYVDMTESDLDAFDLDSVTMWLSSGDASHQRHVQQLVRHGHHYRKDIRVPGSQYFDGLGASEMGHAVFRMVHTEGTNAYDRCVGRPESWVDAVVLDEHGGQVEPGAVGLLGIRSPSVTSGYWNDSLRTARTRMRGYWLTGDLAHTDERGSFYVVDRAVDAIDTEDGVLYSLQTEELLLKNFAELVDCTVIGLGEPGRREPVCLARFTPDAETTVHALLAEANEVLAGLGRPPLRHLLAVRRKDIPVGVTGKVLKSELRGRYPDVAALTAEFGDAATAMVGDRA